MSETLNADTCGFCDRPHAIVVAGLVAAIRTARPDSALPALRLWPGVVGREKSGHDGGCGSNDLGDCVADAAR
jgi:hypothetical protein